MSNKPEMTDEQLAEALANKKFPTITKDGIDAKIKDVKYVREGIFTMCFLTLENGFIVSGYSACADERNYNQEQGEKIAYDNAFRQVWPLEGYLLRETLYQGKFNQAPPEAEAKQGEAA